ncbi:MAG: hypothetical protein AAGF30_07550 [Pseudomonadota bacterium]
MRFTVLPVLMALVTPAWAERAVTAEEFDQMVSGRTFHFDRHGEAYGAEQYFEDKRVIWAFEGGQCQRGIWFENVSGDICFVYDGDPTPQCWSFLEMPSGAFHARSIGAPPADDLVTRDISREALECELPDLGV